MELSSLAPAYPSGMGVVAMEDTKILLTREQQEGLRYLLKLGVYRELCARDKITEAQLTILTHNLYRGKKGSI